MRQPDRVSDADAIRRVLGGHRDDFAILVHHYLPAMEALAYSATGSRQDAEDVVQESFLRAFRYLDHLREPERFGPWLGKIVKNTAWSFLRRRGKSAAPVSHPEAQQAPPTPTVEQREIHAYLRREIGRLDETYRDVLLLHYFAGVSTSEIAKVLNISRSAVLKRLERGRQALGGRLVDALGQGLQTEARRFDEKADRAMGLVAAVNAPWMAALQTTGQSAAGFGFAQKIVSSVAPFKAVALGVALFATTCVIFLAREWPASASGAAQEAPLLPAVEAAAPAQGVVGPASSPAAVAGAAEVSSAQADIASEKELPVATTALEAAETAPKAILVHSPDAPIRIWEDPQPPRGPKGTLVGQVLTLDNRPGANVEVEAYANRGPMLTVSSGTARTDRDGCFEMALPPGAYHVMARGDGLAAVNKLCMAPCMVRAGQTFRTQLRLEPALGVRGAVVDAESGRPLAGVVVVTAGGCRARTDALGAFAFEAVHRADHEIRLVDEEWVAPGVRYTQGAGPCRVELRARRAGVIRGHVYGPGGAPMRGVPVQLALSGSLWHFPFYTTFTDSTGAYFIKGADTARERLPVRAMLNGFRQANGVAMVGFEPGARTLDVDIHLVPDGGARYDQEIGYMAAGGLAEASTSDLPGPAQTAGNAWVGGRVTDPEGYPLPAVFVLSGGNQATTDADGRFQLSGLTGRVADVQVVTAGDMGPGATVARLETFRKDHRLVVEEPECQIRGQVVDKATGRPVQRFFVGIGQAKDARPVNGNDFPDFIVFEEERLVTSDDGTFTLNDLQSGYGGRARLTVRAPGYKNATVPEVWLRSTGNLREPVTRVALASKSADDTGFNGVITAKGTGQPVADALVAVNERDGVGYRGPFSTFDQTVMRFPGSQQTRSDSAGAFAFPDWSDDKGWVAVTRPGFGRKWFRETEFRSPYRVELEPEATVTAVYLDAMGRPVVGALAAIYYYEGDQAIWNDSFETDETGRGVWRGLSPGRYHVVTSHVPWEAEAWVEVAAGENHLLAWRGGMRLGPNGVPIQEPEAPGDAALREGLVGTWERPWTDPVGAQVYEVLYFGKDGALWTGYFVASVPALNRPGFVQANSGTFKVRNGEVHFDDEREPFHWPAPVEVQPNQIRACSFTYTRNPQGLESAIQRAQTASGVSLQRDLLPLSELGL